MKEVNEEYIVEREFDSYSREDFITEINSLRKNLDLGVNQLRELENRIIGANCEIDFLRQVILNLTYNSQTKR